MQEIGTTSYYSGIKVLDTFGLADAHIARTPGRPGAKAAPDYVFGRTPDYLVIRLAHDGLRPGLPADDVYASSGRMAFEYSLAQFFPDASSRLIAVFIRREALVGVESSSIACRRQPGSRVPRPHIAETLTRLELGSAEFAAAGRLHFKRSIEGVQWNPAEVRGSHHAGGGRPRYSALSYFEATIAPPQRGTGGEFVASVAPGNGVHEDVFRWSDTERGPVARDVSVDLSKWRGRPVEVRLRYRAARRGVDRRKPRVVDLDGVVTGQEKTFTVTDIAPPRAGAYDFQWRMLQEGGAWFGATCPNVSVNVTAAQ